MPSIAYAALWNVAGNPAASVPCGHGARRPAARRAAGRAHRRRGDAVLASPRRSSGPVRGPCSPATPPEVPAIEVAGLTMTYGDLRAVDDVSLTVGEGEFVGILGPNGAGKTTLLEMIEGLRQPGAGTATVLGLPVWPRNPELLPRIGVQLQASSFFERLTAREQIHTFAALYGVGTAACRRVARARRPGGEGRHPRRAPLRRPGAAALDRLRAGPRPGASSSSTSRPPRSTRRPGATCGTCCPASTTPAAPSCSPRTTWTRPRCCCDRVAIMDHGRILQLDSPGRADPAASTRRPGSPSPTARWSPPASRPRSWRGWPRRTASTASGCTPAPSRTSSSHLTGREYRA